MDVSRSLHRIRAVQAVANPLALTLYRFTPHWKACRSTSFPHLHVSLSAHHPQASISRFLSLISASLMTHLISKRLGCLPDSRQPPASILVIITPFPLVTRSWYALLLDVFLFFSKLVFLIGLLFFFCISPFSSFFPFFSFFLSFFVSFSLFFPRPFYSSSRFVFERSKMRMEMGAAR